MPPFDLPSVGADLTFAAALPALELALTRGRAAVVQAPPGSGKTTLVPPLVSNLAGRVVVTQPRRVAVRAAARRLAALDGSEPGSRVGWTIRGERKVSARTLVEFVTPGVLLRRLLVDPELAGVDAVVLDEVHERQLDTDLLLGLLGDVRQLRTDLTVVAMSATLDAPRFARLLGTEADPVPVVDSPAALYPLQVTWAPFGASRTDPRGVSQGYLEHLASTTYRAHRAALRVDASVDALVFVPGVREVEQVAGALRRLDGGIEALALHGRIEPAAQDRAVSGRGPGDPPRVVVSTALAESSLTVPGVRLVVDSGLSREPRRDAARGMSGLVTVTAARATMVQRGGRAARLGPGTVVRCFDERTYVSAPAHVTPEILTSDLTSAALTLAGWGTPRGAGLVLPDAPPSPALDAAERALRVLGAIQPDGRVTELGERLAAMPLDPRWGRALLDSGVEFGADPAARVVAALSADLRPAGADTARLLRALAAGDHPGTGAWRRESVRLARLVGGHPEGVRGRDDDVLATTIARAWPERIARLVEGRTYLLAQGTRAALPSDSELLGEQWLAIAEVGRAEGREADGTGAVIRAAARIEEEQACRMAGTLLETVDTADLSNGRVQGRRVQRLGAIELSATPVRLPADRAEQAVVEALETDGLGLLRFSPAASGLLRRLAFLHLNLGEPWPDVGEARLLSRWQEWLAPEVRRIAAGTPVARVELLDAVRRLLPWPAAAELEKIAPERLRVPSGNTAAVRYPEVGDPGPPVVEVKLQECFGLAESPRLAGVPVLFHLLSPAGRPLAVTSDLASFWSGPYAGVRAEMRGRYPKHPWPEDPWSATATHLTKNRAARPR